jgi:hypothetical protein
MPPQNEGYDAIISRDAGEQRMVGLTVRHSGTWSRLSNSTSKDKLYLLYTTCIMEGGYGDVNKTNTVADVSGVSAKDNGKWD